MTPEAAQEFLDRAWEAGAFEDEPPAGFAEGCDYTDRRKFFRADKANKLLGVDAWTAKYDVAFSGMRPRLRGFYQKNGQFAPDKGNLKDAHYWIEELWNAFLRGLGAPVVDWETT